jgi:hypothetical protein
MALYPTLFGHVDLPCPEPLRRPDRLVAQEAGIRLVRLGERVPAATRRSYRSDA